MTLGQHSGLGSAGWVFCKFHMALCIKLQSYGDSWGLDVLRWPHSDVWHLILALAWLTHLPDLFSREQHSEKQHQCTRAFQAFACIIGSDSPLAKADQIAKYSQCGRRLHKNMGLEGHDSLGAAIWMTYYHWQRWWEEILIIIGQGNVGDEIVEEAPRLRILPLV